jgi:hypothetical protein
MFVIFGEFLLCGFIIAASLLLGRSHARIAETLFVAYVGFMLLNYFVVRWRHESLKRSVAKFNKLRKKVSNFDFGLTAPAAKAPPKTLKKAK